MPPTSRPDPEYTQFLIRLFNLQPPLSPPRPSGLLPPGTAQFAPKGSDGASPNGFPQSPGSECGPYVGSPCAGPSVPFPLLPAAPPTPNSFRLQKRSRLCYLGSLPDMDGEICNRQRQRRQTFVPIHPPLDWRAGPRESLVDASDYYGCQRLDLFLDWAT